eukprot:737069_1
MSVPQKSLSVESTDSERERERQWEFQLRFPANQLGVDTDGEDSQNEMDSQNEKEEEEEEEVLYADEADKYLDIKLSKAERRVCMDNPLIWWQQNPHDLILMQRLARFVFTIKGSSCPSEGMFRDYGNIVGAKTARLNEKKAEDTLFLHQLRKGLDD